MRTIIALFGIACLVSLTEGCGPPGAKTPSFYPVKGQVLLDGKPARFAIVALSPKNVEGDNDDPPASGQTNADGEFSIRTWVGPGYDGALPGEYWITVSAPRKAPAEAKGEKPT